MGFNGRQNTDLKNIFLMFSRICVDFTDVLCGRGSAANNHIGNIRFREMVKEYQSIYRSACKADKPIIALQIVLKLKSLSPPGRFLTKPPLKESTSTSSSTKRKTEVDFWIEIDEEQATRKVAQRLREKKTSLAETRRRLRFEESQRVKRQQQQQQQDGEEEEASSINVTSTGTIGHGDLAPTPLSSNKQLNLASEVIKEEGITFSAGSDDVKLPAVIVVRNTDRDSTIMMTTADEDSCGFSSSSDAYPPMKSPRCSAKDGATSTPYCDFSCFDNGIYDQQQPQERYGDIIASQTESLPAQVNIIEQEEASNNEDDDILDDDLCTAMQDDHFYYGNTATAATAAAVTKPSMFGEPEKVSTKVEYMPTAALLVSVFDDL